MSRTHRTIVVSAAIAALTGAAVLMAAPALASTSDSDSTQSQLSGVADSHPRTERAESRSDDEDEDDDDTAGQAEPGKAGKAGKADEHDTAGQAKPGKAGEADGHSTTGGAKAGTGGKAGNASVSDTDDSTEGAGHSQDGQSGEVKEHQAKVTAAKPDRVRIDSPATGQMKKLPGDTSAHPARSSLASTPTSTPTPKPVHAPKAATKATPATTAHSTSPHDHAQHRDPHPALPGLGRQPEPPKMG
ncbi:hypothetical protein [Pseudonocardia spinosispora]|uniref:hypothetical protein n=1 Tax=Pseudonocardia spinosispora TaxID=103441 RepID=UPI00048F6FF4|nr:hypothetical protein [Pseudonocardia spinosispora]